MTLVNTVATALAGQPGAAGLHAAIDALKAAGAPAAIDYDGVAYGSARAGETIPLVAGGSAVGALRLDVADPELANAVAAMFAVSLAGRAEAAQAAQKPLMERLLEPIVDAAPTAITVCEPGTWRILSANAAMRALVGYGDDDIVGAEPPYPWWGEPPARPIREWTPTDRWEQLYRHADGTVVPVEGTTFTLNGADGEPERVINLVTDLSERRRFEQQLVQSSKLASIGELAAGVAHEINNPLFAILGLVEFLLKDVEPGTKAQERLLLVQQTGLEIKEIVRALLDFARERSDEFEPVPLELVVRQTLDLVRKTSAKKGIEILERYPDEELTVNASANQLKQVVLNLVTNAQHAMPDGGTISVAVARSGPWATATVTDSGTGIPAAALEKIFDPFYTTKRDVGGTGLGLSVSLGIAQMHGGELVVASDERAGASFTLRVPLAS